MNTISNSENFFATYIFSYCSCRPYDTVGARVTPHFAPLHPIALPFLLDNNENYAFMGMEWRFFEVLPLTLKVKRRPQAFLRIKIEVESLSIIQQWNNFSKLWFSFRSSVKAFERDHCHKLILNNINKMDIFQRCIQKSVKHLKRRVFQKQVTAEDS